MDTEDDENCRQSELKYDDIIQTIGDFGTYQKRLYVLIILPSIFSAYTTMSSVFYLGDHSHSCAIPKEKNETFDQYGNSSEYGNNTLIYSKCVISKTSTENTSTSVVGELVENYTCKSWVYDNLLYEATVISDFNLVCERRSLRSHAKMVIFAGNMVGSLTVGVLADIFGRKPTLCLSLIAMVILSFATVWVPTYELFLVFRFIYGVVDQGYYLTACVIGLELVGPSKRIWTGFIINFTWCFGELLLCGMAFWLRKWRFIQLAVAVPMTIFIFYWRFIPESPRWLILRGRRKEAFKIFKNAAIVNKVSLQICEINDLEKQLTFQEKEAAQKNSTKHPIKSTAVAIVTSKKMMITTSIMALNCFVAYAGYYGLSLTLGNLAGNIYINFLISVLVEICAYVFCILLFDKVGHRRFHSGNLLIGGIACLCTAVTFFLIKKAPFWITIASTMIGKLSVSAIYAEIFVYISELYPTAVRTLILGIMSLIGQIGSVTSPYIADIAYYIDSDFGQALPVIIFGSSMAAAGLLALFLPETKHTNLPDTIIEAKSFKRSRANGNTQNLPNTSDKNGTIDYCTKEVNTNT